MQLPVIQNCPSCETPQTLPAIFCGNCGTPLIGISKTIMSVFLTITVAAYAVYGLYSQQLSWPAPLYLYYVFLFVGVSLVITRRHRIMSFRVVLWSLLLLYIMWLLWLSQSMHSVLYHLSDDVGDIVRDIQNSPYGIPAVLAVLVFQLVLGFIVLWRRFGFTLAYRVLGTLLAITLFALRFAFSYATERTEMAVSPKLSDHFFWMPEATVEELMELVSLNVMRALAAEMAIYSFIKCFGPATDHYKKLAAHMAQTGSSAGAGNIIAMSSGQLTRGFIRAGIYIQHFCAKLYETLKTYLWALYRVLRRITVDFIVPLVTLISVGFLLGLLAEHSAAYITGIRNPRLLFIKGITSPLVMMLLAILGIFVAQMTFLRTVTKFLFKALWRCNTLLLLWVAPFFFALFVFVSISLWLTGQMLHRWGNETFPFRLGILTGVSGAALVILLAFSAFSQWKAAKRAMDRPSSEGEAEEAHLSSSSDQ